MTLSPARPPSNFVIAGAGHKVPLTRSLGMLGKLASSYAESRYRALFDVIDEGFCVVRMVFDRHQRPVDFEFLDANPAFERQSGLKNVEGRFVRQLVPGLEQYWFDFYGRIALTGEPVRFESRVAALEGRWFDVFAFRVDEPEERHVAVLFTDISERRRMWLEREASLAREQKATALLDAFSESAPVGLAFFDRKLRYQRINSRLASMTGLPAAAHIGKRPDELFHHIHDLPWILKRWEDVLATGEPWLGVEVRGESPTSPGDVRTWQESFFPVRVQGEIVGLGCVAEDITDRKCAAEALAASEARFRRLIEVGPVGIAVIEPDGRVVLANDTLLKMLGYRREELDELNWRDRTPAEYLQLDTAAMETLRRGESAAPFEQDFIRKSGTRISALVVAQFLPGEGERRIAYALDVTDRRRAASELRESEARLRRVIDNMTGFVAMLDVEGTLLEIGEPALRMGGLHRDEVIGTKFWDCDWWLHNSQQRQRIREWCSEAAGGATVRHDVVARTAEDGRLDVDLMLAPVFDGEGRVTHVVPSGVDISARKRMERALLENENRLSQAANALQDADRRKDDFLATLAHELRNPLAPIRNGVQILRLVASGDPTLQRTTEMMDRQVTHLVRLVDDLLDVSRITRGKVELRHEPVILNHVLSSALESVQSLLESRGHALHVENPRQPLVVQGDPDRLTQVFANLLSNAAKFTPGEGTVWVTLCAEGNDAVVTVRDTGIGIPPEKLQTVFEMFSQVQAPRGNDGLGIGLSLVRSLVQLHSGTVIADSEGEGRGSRFIVRLPLAGDAVRRSNASNGGEPVPAHTPSNGEGAPANRQRILVVDDNADAAESLEKLLRLQGHEVRSCQSGQEAIAAVGEFSPSLIFMDLGMPGMDGLTTARNIRAKPGGEKIRIVALTGWGQDADRERTRQAGIDAHLVKPIGVEALSKVLRPAL